MPILHFAWTCLPQISPSQISPTCLLFSLSVYLKVYHSLSCLFTHYLLSLPVAISHWLFLYIWNSEWKPEYELFIHPAPGLWVAGSPFWQNCSPCLVIYALQKAWSRACWKWPKGSGFSLYSAELVKHFPHAPQYTATCNWSTVLRQWLHLVSLRLASSNEQPHTSQWLYCQNHRIWQQFVSLCEHGNFNRGTVLQAAEAYLVKVFTEASLHAKHVAITS